jgi:hypothetical protein
LLRVSDHNSLRSFDEYGDNQNLVADLLAFVFLSLRAHPDLRSPTFHHRKAPTPQDTYTTAHHVF